MDSESGDILQISEIRIHMRPQKEKYPAKLHARRVASTLNVRDGLIYIRGTETLLYPDSDMPQPFRQGRYFYYISGVNEPDCIVTYDIKRDYLILYIPERDPTRVIFDGEGLTVAQAYERYEVDDVRFTSEQKPDLQVYSSSNPNNTIYTLYNSSSLADFLDKRPENSQLSDRGSVDLRDVIDLCRVRKTPYEIKMIERANEISSAAHKEVMKRISSLQTEMDVEALFLQKCVQAGAKTQAYGIIAASGENASTLHYIKNNESMVGRQLLLVDAACEWECYAADITRTIPINGRFSKEARSIYNLVLQMQETCIDKIAPGVIYADLHYLAQDIAVDGLMDLGILHNGSRSEIIKSGVVKAFFPHGLGHHVGLDVHDVLSLRPILSASEDREPLTSVAGPYNLVATAAPLEEGMVVTVEPGIYFSKYLLDNYYLALPRYSQYINTTILDRYYDVGGVRIEDCILVTRRGYRNLTTAPKEDELLAINSDSA